MMKRSQVPRIAMPSFRAVILWLALTPPCFAVDLPTVVVVGPTQSRSMNSTDLESMSPREVTVTDPHGGKVARYKGVPLIKVLASVGAPAGDSLRGQSLALHVRIEATDGYVAAFSLAELDDAFGGTDAILAFQKDDQPLGTDTGPFRLVVPTDKRAGRWVRNVIKISVLQ